MATEEVATTCEATATIEVGRFTSADVTCGKERHSAEEAHLTAQPTTTADGGHARIVFLWF